MKRPVFPLILLGLSTLAFSQNEHVISKTDNSVTFVVDENLPAPNKRFRKQNYTNIARNINTNHYDVPKVIASSFTNDSLYLFSKDVFYSSVVYSYADHRPIMITPDMIWLVISKGFAQYVNAHSEELRSKLVDHEGYKTLQFITTKSLKKMEESDWLTAIDSFSVQISRNTKDNIAETLQSDFSTTTANERIASQITLMKSMEKFFKYEVVRVICGIPYITLKGTPDDWRRVLEKTKKLAQYGLENWVAALEPILLQFVQATEGNPDREFWKGIVKKERVDVLTSASVRCSGSIEGTTTILDGWILNFYVNDNGDYYKEIPCTVDMPADQVRVKFKYKECTENGKVLMEKPLEFVSGFVGFDIDSQGVIIPRIGWFIQDEIKEDKEQR